MYLWVLAVHNVLRWIVVFLGILALARALTGWLSSRLWSPLDRRIGTFFSVSLDVQLLLGAALYFALSPVTRAALQDFGAAMGSEGSRFFALEHALYMLVAVVFGHLGAAAVRSAAGGTARHRRAAAWFALAIVAIALGMPWFRPLLPGLG